MSSTEPATNAYTVQVNLKTHEYLYLNEEMADFHFVFESSSERIPAHKLLLGASDIFRRMINGTWLEKTEAKIGDASPSAFKEFLQFFYLPQAKLTIENIDQVMNLANMYNMIDCLTACKEFLMTTLTSETVCLGYEPAILLDQKDLIGFCEEKIKTHTSKVLSSTSFLKSDLIVLSNILKLELLYCTGAELAEAFMSWVKSNSMEQHLTRDLIQEHLKDVFYTIPFGSMLLKDFNAFDRKYQNLFTYDEFREIIQLIGSEDYQPELFKANRKMLVGKTLKWDEDGILRCNQYDLHGDDRWSFNNDEYDYCPYFIKHIETSSFSTNKAMLLGAVIFEDLSEYRENGFEETENVSTKITITKTKESTPDDGSIVYKGKAVLSGSGDTRIQFPEPILIEAGFEYEIQMVQKPTIGCCTQKSLQSEVGLWSGEVESEEPDITLTFQNSAVGEVTKGLIYKYLFNRI